MKSTPLRNFRIDDSIWQPAMKAAKELGVPLTLVVKTALKAFAKNPQITIGEAEEIFMPESTTLLAEKLHSSLLKKKKSL